MPILQGAKQVFITSSDFKDIHGNYVNYGNPPGANRGRGSMPPREHFRVHGQYMHPHAIPGPSGGPPAIDIIPANVENLVNGITNGSINGGNLDVLRDVLGPGITGNGNTIDGREMVFNHIFSPPTGNTTNTPPPNSFQNMTGSSGMYTGNVQPAFTQPHTPPPNSFQNMTGSSSGMYTGNAQPPAFTQQQRYSPPAGGSDGDAFLERMRRWQEMNPSSPASPTPAPNGVVTPPSLFPQADGAGTNGRRDSSFTMSSFTMSSGMNTQSSPPLSTSGQENGQNWQFPHNVNSPTQSFQYVNIPHMSVQSSPFSTQSSAFDRSPMPSSPANLSGNDARGSILPERPLSRSPPHDSEMPSQGGSAAQAAVPAPQAAVNEALNGIPLEKRAGFLGF